MIQVSLISIDEACVFLETIKLELFQEPFWWRIIDKGFGKYCQVALVTDKGTPVALMPIFFHKIGPIVRVGSPLRGTFTPYIGLIQLSKNFDHENQQNYLRSVINYLIKKGANWIEISCFFEKFSACDTLESLGFINESPKTIILKTNKNKEFLWMNMQGRSRNLVRKAYKFGLTVDVLNGDVKNVESFYSMLNNTFRKSGKRPPHSIDFYKLLASSAINSSNLLFLSIKKDSDIISMGMFLYNLNEIHFISGASTSEGNKYGANNMLHWEVIKFACKNGINNYDFGGLGIPAIDKFKRSFGGVESHYQMFAWMKPSVRLLFNIYIWLRSKVGYFYKGK